MSNLAGSEVDLVECIGEIGEFLEHSNYNLHSVDVGGNRELIVGS